MTFNTNKVTFFIAFVSIFVSQVPVFAQAPQNSMCARLKDPNLPDYARQALEARCRGQAEGTVNAKIVDGVGVVSRFQNGQWIVIGTANNIGSDWTINYEKRAFTFISPDGGRSITVPTGTPD